MTKIALIDDEIPITTMLQKSLSKNKDFEVSAYNNPKEGLAQLSNLNPDVVLLDIMMPQMDGIEVLTEIKKNHPKIKVIMMTAYSTLDRVLASHKIGAEDYIMKPFESLKAVEDKILKVLKK